MNTNKPFSDYQLDLLEEKMTSRQDQLLDSLTKKIEKLESEKKYDEILYVISFLMISLTTLTSYAKCFEKAYPESIRVPDGEKNIDKLSEAIAEVTSYLRFIAVSRSLSRQMYQENPDLKPESENFQEIVNKYANRLSDADLNSEVKAKIDTIGYEFINVFSEKKVNDFMPSVCENSMAILSLTMGILDGYIKEYEKNLPEQMKIKNKCKKEIETIGEIVHLYGKYLASIVTLELGNYCGFQDRMNNFIQSLIDQGITPDHFIHEYKNLDK